MPLAYSLPCLMRQLVQCTVQEPLLSCRRFFVHLGAKVGDQPVRAALGCLLAAREVQVAQARPRLRGGVQVPQQRHLRTALASVWQHSTRSPGSAGSPGPPRAPRRGSGHPAAPPARGAGLSAAGDTVVHPAGYAPAAAHMPIMSHWPCVPAARRGKNHWQVRPPVASQRRVPQEPGLALPLHRLLKAAALAAAAHTAVLNTGMHRSACPMPTRKTTGCKPAPALGQQGQPWMLLRWWPAPAGAGCGA